MPKPSAMSQKKHRKTNRRKTMRVVQTTSPSNQRERLENILKSGLYNGKTLNRDTKDIPALNPMLSRMMPMNSYFPMSNTSNGAMNANIEFMKEEQRKKDVELAKKFEVQKKEELRLLKETEHNKKEILASQDRAKKAEEETVHLRKLFEQKEQERAAQIQHQHQQQEIKEKEAIARHESLMAELKQSQSKAIQKAELDDILRKNREETNAIIQNIQNKQYVEKTQDIQKAEKAKRKVIRQQEMIDDIERKQKDMTDALKTKQRNKELKERKKQFEETYAGIPENPEERLAYITKLQSENEELEKTLKQFQSVKTDDEQRQQKATQLYQTLQTFYEHNLTEEEQANIGVKIVELAQGLSAGIQMNKSTLNEVLAYLKQRNKTLQDDSNTIEAELSQTSNLYHKYQGAQKLSLDEYNKLRGIVALDLNKPIESVSKEDIAMYNQRLHEATSKLDTDTQLYSQIQKRKEEIAKKQQENVEARMKLGMKDTDTIQAHIDSLAGRKTDIEIEREKLKIAQNVETEKQNKLLLLQQEKHKFSQLFPGKEANVDDEFLARQRQELVDSSGYLEKVKQATDIQEKIKQSDMDAAARLGIDGMEFEHMPQEEKTVRIRERVAKSRLANDERDMLIKQIDKEKERAARLSNSMDTSMRQLIEVFPSFAQEYNILFDTHHGVIPTEEIRGFLWRFFQTLSHNVQHLIVLKAFLQNNKEIVDDIKTLRSDFINDFIDRLAVIKYHVGNTKIPDTDEYGNYPSEFMREVQTTLDDRNDQLFHDFQNIRVGNAHPMPSV